MYDLIVFGDINLDISARNQLSFAFSDLTTNGIVSWSPIDELPGGTGLNFARISKEFNFSPFIIGCVGQDYAGDILVKYVNENNIGNGINVIKEYSTGKAIILRDNKDIRLLNDNSPNANQFLTSKMVFTYEKLLLSAKYIYISGYTIINQNFPRFNAIIDLLKLISKFPQINLIWDVVPHKVYDAYSIDEYFTLIKRTNILVSEVQTLRRFFNMGNKYQEINETLAFETAEKTKTYFNKFCLRWGPSGTDFEIVYDGNKYKYISNSHHLQSNQDKRGYGDRLVLNSLRNIFDKN